MMVDFDIIIIGGGLFKVDGVVDVLWQVVNDVQIGDFIVFLIVIVQGGDVSGVCGVVYVVWQVVYG